MKKVFFQVDIELSFTTQEHIKQLVEDMLYFAFPEDLKALFPVPFERMTYAEAMTVYGSDKPDTRFGYTVIFDTILKEKKKTIQSNFSIFFSRFPI